MAPKILVETVAVTAVRLALFYSCRTYLLRSLYQDLRKLSTTNEGITSSPVATTPIALTPYSLPSSPVPMSNTDLESESVSSSLPLPSTTPRRNPKTHLPLPAAFADGPSNSTRCRKEGGLQSSLARTTFGLCFSEACILFFLALCQPLHVFDAKTRRLNWDISLTILVCLILLLSPLLQCILITYRPSISPSSRSPQVASHRFGKRFILTLVPYTIYLIAVYRIPVPEGLQSSGMLSSSFSRLTVIGVIILGLISGYGAISTAFMFFKDIARSDWIEPTAQDIMQAEQSLQRVRTDLADRLEEVRKRRYSLEGATGDSSSSSGGGWISKVWSLGGTISRDSELTSLQREIKGLEALEFEMTRHLAELKTSKARIQFSKTFLGRIWKWIGWGFGLYCAWRVFSSAINLILPRRTSPSSPPTSQFTDIPTKLAITLVLHLPFLPPSVHDVLTSPERMASLSHQITLLLIGCIVLVSIRSVLRGVGWFLRLVSGSSGSSASGPASKSSGRRALVANFMLLVLAQLLGVYLLSTLVQGIKELSKVKNAEWRDFVTGI
ncbi:hypothetical protein FRC03_010505 [Tulasnella sp. 419]|nr:hypothetical protein FRC03_010505 [Tulasnella sp. 419]